ncbi:sugar kinase [Chthonobacter rhizosphaerae]|uniref:sugar kinase n=1 Tax=Chthonobacter rhizosphaerae TaxID=2735553 RepID=UPI0024846EC2|nr:sugar kinase [Chthonobacter rhizosphaerae]
MKRVFASIGECMVELSSAGERLYRQGFAGDTFNTAWYVRALLDPAGWTVRYVTGIGDDKLSDELADFIADAGIDTSALMRKPGRPIGLYAIHLDGHERSFSYWRETAAAKLLAEDAGALRDALRDVECAYFSGITLAILAPEHRRTLLTALAEVRARGSMVAFDPNIRMRLWPDSDTARAALIEGYRVCTIAMPTYPDDRDLFGDADLAACVRRVAGYGPTEIVAKDGADPTLVSVDGVETMVPAVKVDAPVDTTGAGDSFNAGYLAARLAGKDPVEATRMGHRVASRVIGVKGALAPMEGFAGMV